MAAAALKPSLLSDQTELLKDDLDIATLEIIVAGRRVLDLRPRITSAPVSRTTDGASTLTLNVRDKDRAVARSGFVNSGPADVEIDGLWFRFKGFNKQGDDLELTFEAREVAVLRDWPKPTAAHKGFKVWDARQVSRLDVAKFLVAEAAADLQIPFVTLGGAAPIAKKGDAPSQAARKATRSHGFAPGAKVTVKGKTASPLQRDVIDRVLQTGESLGARRKVLVVAVMTITQESAAGADVGHDPHARGPFQQNPDDGWPATGIPETDAAAFFEAAISDDRKNPNLGYGELAQDVQLSAFPKAYDQWRSEAEQTVTAWGVSSTDPPGATTLLSTDSSFQFMRGTKTTANGKTIYTREDNWSMLQRLASEVNWRCFAVSGAIYFVTDNDLLASQPRMTISEQTPGVDSIDGSFDEGRQSIRKGHRVQKLNQQITIPCRIGRWQAPPGSAVEIEDTVIFDGRWLVNTIDRDLFKPDGTITLHRPQAALAEAKAPEYLQVGGATVFTGNQGADATGASSQVRAAIVAAALRAVELRADFRYDQVRPYPSSLFGGAIPKRVDCSSFFTLCYKAGGADDPNGLGYNGTGNTATLVSSGAWTDAPQAGDAVFYGSDRSYPHHVAVFVGEGLKIVNMGGPGDPREMAVADVPLPLLGYMSFFGGTPSDTHHHG